MSSAEKAFYNTVDPSTQTLGGMTLAETPSKAGTINSAKRESVQVEDVNAPVENKEPSVAGENAGLHQDETGLLTGMRLYLVFLALMLAVFVSKTRNFVCAVTDASQMFALGEH